MYDAAMLLVGVTWELQEGILQVQGLMFTGIELLASINYCVAVDNDKNEILKGKQTNWLFSSLIYQCEQRKVALYSCSLPVPFTESHEFLR